MNLTLTPEANISIIFDADKGDVISGVGRGNMQIFIKRTGAFDIFGDYQIENGKYLLPWHNCRWQNLLKLSVVAR